MNSRKFDDTMLHGVGPTILGTMFTVGVVGFSVLLCIGLARCHLVSSCDHHKHATSRIETLREFVYLRQGALDAQTCQR